MDHELKQRLIGAVVVTALCAIFIPMLFDDPVDNSGQLVSELNIPAPVEAGTNTADKLPTSADQVSKLPDPEPLSTETANDTLESTGAAEEIIDEPVSGQSKQGESLYTESEGYTREDAGAEEVIEPEDKQPKSRLKQVPAEQPLPAANATDGIRKSIAPKVQAKEPRVEVIAKEPVKVKKAVEPTRLAVKKPEVESPIDGAKVGALGDAARQPILKQPSSAKSLAAAVAEAKKPVPVAVPKASPKLVRWYIQLGSFSKKENAMSLWESLHEQGLPASLDTVQTDKGTSYRLRVGPELDGKKAAAMKSRLDKQNIKAILISE
ncbi:MAG: SPOR domain-containing protein [Methylobacter sp.]|uniref:SPOR domain-containing protein n=1 Tax=Methylobacter sp. TaxID=2051955 RepID=UPI0027314098|nr:SPOR domain-containing protein [Methylobacter sp.]MDP1665709.1 SPOR domain-containing protein [Methylobacter sp.]MDP1970075.1 SPOR domain-containing protein [Methylobacter sp.]